MIAALVNAGITLDEPNWLAMAKRAFEFIARNMTKGDRLGHSWRDGKLLFPGLASDFAAMIRAALALYEATGERAYLELALTWQAAFDARTTPIKRLAGIIFPPTMRPTCSYDPIQRRMMQRPIPTRLPRKILYVWPRLLATTKWREKADRLIEGILSAAERKLFGHVALLNALDLRLGRSRDRRDWKGLRTRCVRAALKLPFVERIVLRAADTTELPASHPAPAKIKSSPNAIFVCIGERCSLPIMEPSR